MKELSVETKEFICRHASDDVRALALQTGRYPQVDMGEAVVQIAGRQIAGKKIPSWAKVEDILYPRHLSLEQCSSEITARYKASLAEGDTLADLTGGLGVDCSFMSRKFRSVDYVERQESLCELARHNFPLLGLPHVSVHHADGTAYLEEMKPVDCLFLDPARRDSHGGKTVAIADCEPDVCALEPLLVSKGRMVMVKLSPMLDVVSALHELRFVRQVHIVSVNNECKELIFVLGKTDLNTQLSVDEIAVSCEQVVNNFSSQHFDFTLGQEKNSVCTMAEKVEDYLFEPGAALLKAGPFRLLGERFGVKKLAANSHLYTSSRIVDFPGRCFQVVEVSGFGKKELKAFMKGMEKANLTVRNFPATVAELRKKLKLGEGGEFYVFATTLADGRKVLVKCRKITAVPGL